MNGLDSPLFSKHTWVGRCKTNTKNNFHLNPNSPTKIVPCRSILCQVKYATQKYILSVCSIWFR